MAELATIARPYAEALFQAVQADLGVTERWLEALARVSSQPALQALAVNPKVDAAQVFDLIVGVLSEPLPPAGVNLLRAVLNNGRLVALPEIAEQFRARKNARAGVSDALVYSAFPIDSAALADLSAVLEKRFARKLKLSVSLDPELIGGVRVVVGDEVLDTSVRARLEYMKLALSA
jgi:F-type H+-transporting ATPase subunit delta